MRVLVILLALATVGSAGYIVPELEDILAKAGPNEMIPVIVYMKEQADLDLLDGATRAEKVQLLKTTAERTQPSLLDYLRDRDAGDIRPFWICNSVAFAGTPATIQAVAGRSEVEFVTDDFVIRIDDAAQAQGPERGRKVMERPVPARPRAVPVASGPTRRDHRTLSRPGISVPPAPADVVQNPTWNVARVKAPECWSAGYTGDRVVVGTIDTGADLMSHPSLSGKLLQYYGWFDAFGLSDLPYDDNGHGTHVLGLICGGDGDGPDTADIGVAPRALCVVAKGLDRTGSANVSTITRCFEWFGRARILCNSWSYARTSVLFWQQCKNLNSLGVILVFAIGNQEGAGPGSCISPGSFPVVIGVGATDSLDNIAGFSTRGPAPNAPPWDSTAYWGRPDWNYIKPDIVAPGVSVTSAGRRTRYSLASGTSQAAPLVAGCIALMLEKNPFLTNTQVYNLLLNSADPLGSPYPNNTYGWGRLNCLRAVNAVPLPGDDAKTVSIDVPRVVVPETTISISAIIKNVGANAQSDVPVWLNVTNRGGYSFRVNASSGPLLPGESRQLVFSPGWAVPPAESGSVYDVTVRTYLPTDSNPYNDSVARAAFINTLVIPPYTQSFDTSFGVGGGEYRLPVGWRSTNRGWYQGWNYWYSWWYCLDHRGAGVDAPDTLMSPVFDCSAPGPYWLSYYHEFDLAPDCAGPEEYNDSLVVLVSADGGSRWAPIACYTGEPSIGYRAHDVTAVVRGSRQAVFAFACPREPDVSIFVDDFVIGSAPVIAEWRERALMPLGQSGKTVKAGGALAAFDDTTIYAFKGNKTCEFSSFNTRRDSWRTETSIPMATERQKAVGAGGSLCSDRSRYVYALKGNNTNEFWRYDTRRESTAWQRLPDVPGDKKVKQGSGIAFLGSADSGSVYCFKMSGKAKWWYRYDCSSGQWVTSISQPPDSFQYYSELRGDSFWSRQTYGKGASLAASGSWPYLLCCGKPTWWSGIVLSYEPRCDSWTQYSYFNSVDELYGNPDRDKPWKEGSAIAGDPEGRWLFGVKGGNRRELHVIDFLHMGDCPAQLESIPRLGADGKKKGFKKGAAACVADGRLYALKGNNTRQLWSYWAPWMQADSGPVIQRDGPVCRNARPKHEQRPMVAAPTICRGQVGLRYSLAGNDCVRMTVHDIAGRVVRRSSTRGRAGPSRVDADLTGLPVGVYVLRLESEGYQTSQKLVVVR